MTNDKTQAIIITAILAIAILEGIALLTGTDGAYFALVIAAVSGLAGYEIKTFVNNPKQ